MKTMEASLRVIVQLLSIAAIACILFGSADFWPFALMLSAFVFVGLRSFITDVYDASHQRQSFEKKKRDARLILLRADLNALFVVHSKMKSGKSTAFVERELRAVGNIARVAESVRFGTDPLSAYGEEDK